MRIGVFNPKGFWHPSRKHPPGFAPAYAYYHAYYKKKVLVKRVGQIKHLCVARFFGLLFVKDALIDAADVGETAAVFKLFERRNSGPVEFRTACPNV